MIVAVSKTLMKMMIVKEPSALSCKFCYSEAKKAPVDASVREALRALRAASLSEFLGAHVVLCEVVLCSGLSAFGLCR